MNLETLALPIGFLICLSVLLWFLITAKGKWYIKCVIIITFPLYSFLLWNSLYTYLGWPTPEETPDRFILYKGIVREPFGNDKGAIFLFLKDYPRHKKEQTRAYSFFSYKADKNMPRVHKLPYSRRLHEMLDKIEMLQRLGMTIIMEKGKGDSLKGIPGDKKQGEGREGDGEGSGHSRHQEFIFYQLPPGKPGSK